MPKMPSKIKNKSRADGKFTPSRAKPSCPAVALLEPYDWGPGGVPEGQPIRYEPGKGWKVGE